MSNCSPCNARLLPTASTAAFSSRPNPARSLLSTTIVCEARYAASLPGSRYSWNTFTALVPSCASCTPRPPHPATPPAAAAPPRQTCPATSGATCSTPNDTRTTSGTPPTCPAPTTLTPVSIRSVWHHRGSRTLYNWTPTDWHGHPRQGIALDPVTAQGGVTACAV